MRGFRSVFAKFAGKLCATYSKQALKTQVEPIFTAWEYRLQCVYTPQKSCGTRFLEVAAIYYIVKAGVYVLALTRKKGESIIIGDNIEVVVLGMQGDQVKIGVIAPKQITVHRKEIYEQIQNENIEAAKNTKISIETLNTMLNNKDAK